MATLALPLLATVPAPMLAVFGIGVPELLLIFGVLILLFGATKLPSLAKGLGQSIKEFKKATQEDSTEDKTKAKAKKAESAFQPTKNEDSAE